MLLLFIKHINNKTIQLMNVTFVKQVIRYKHRRKKITLTPT